MKLKQKVRRVGNSLVITLPKRMAEMMGVEEGDDLEVGIKNKRLTIVLEKNND